MILQVKHSVVAILTICASIFASTSARALCQISEVSCPNHPLFVGTFFDNALNAGSNQTECMQRASDYHRWCGLNGTLSTTATFSSGGQVLQSVTVEPSTCQITEAACPNHPSFVGTFTDNYLNSSSNQVECMQRASNYYRWCGLSGSQSSKAIYSAGGIVLESATAPTPAATAISNCRAFTQSGNYVLNGNVTDSSNMSYCFDFSNASNVQLDCAGHSISINSSTPFYFSHSNHVTVKNCVEQSSINVHAVEMFSSSNVTISTSNFGTISGAVGGFYIKDTQSLSITENIIANGMINIISSSDVFITNNNKSYTVSNAPVFDLQTNQCSNMTIQGNVFNAAEWDDTILMFDPSNVLIDSNLILNASDAGIEGEGKMDTVTITNNTISNVGTCGIGGWYASATSNFEVVNSTIKNNTITEITGALGFPGTVFLFDVPGLGMSATDSDDTMAAEMPSNTFSGDVRH